MGEVIFEENLGLMGKILNPNWVKISGYDFSHHIGFAPCDDGYEEDKVLIFKDVKFMKMVEKGEIGFQNGLELNVLVESLSPYHMEIMKVVGVRVMSVCGGSNPDDP